MNNQNIGLSFIMDMKLAMAEIDNNLLFSIVIIFFCMSVIEPVIFDKPTSMGRIFLFEFKNIEIKNAIYINRLNPVI